MQYHDVNIYAMMHVGVVPETGLNKSSAIHAHLGVFQGILAEPPFLYLKFGAVLC